MNSVQSQPVFLHCRCSYDVSFDFDASRCIYCLINFSDTRSGSATCFVVCRMSYVE
jgi:hypothetical protein